VKVFVEGLQHPDHRVQLAAAISLVGIGESARGAIPAMQLVMKSKQKSNHALYARWALGYALKRLE
jgi:hypothetical protein